MTLIALIGYLAKGKVNRSKLPFQPLPGWFRRRSSGGPLENCSFEQGLFAGEASHILDGDARNFAQRLAC
jgi:hypothetical protein